MTDSNNTSLLTHKPNEANRQDVLIYIGQMSEELAELAALIGSDALSRALNLAALEAHKL
jgi:hypothetical protein